MQEKQCRRIIGWKSARPEWTGKFDYFQTRCRYVGELAAIQRVSPMDLPPILTAEEVVRRCVSLCNPLERLCEDGWPCPLPSYAEEPLRRKCA